MRKIAVLLLVGAAVVAFTACDAMAYRFYGGTYTVPQGGVLGGYPWQGDVGSGPFPYTPTGGALSDATTTGADVVISETHQLMSANPAQLSYPPPDYPPWALTCRSPGDTNMWWGATPGNDRFTAAVLDLGQEVEINALVNIMNAGWSSSIRMQQFEVQGSHTGLAGSWTRLIYEDVTPDGYIFYEDSGDLFGLVRPASIPIGLFYNPATGLYDLDTVTYRYLSVAISRSASADSVGMSEFVIDAVPEPATILMLVGGGLLGLLRRKS